LRVQVTIQNKLDDNAILISSHNGVIPAKSLNIPCIVEKINRDEQELFENQCVELFTDDMKTFKVRGVGRSAIRKAQRISLNAFTSTETDSLEELNTDKPILIKKGFSIWLNGEEGFNPNFTVSFDRQEKPTCTLNDLSKRELQVREYIYYDVTGRVTLTYNMSGL